MMNSGPVLYYLIFAKKRKKKFLLLFKYICIWWYLGRAVGIVYPVVLATKWDEVVNIFEPLSNFPYVAHFNLRDCHSGQNLQN